jgi:hypothetical protein
MKNRIKDYIKGKYKIEFKDGRIVFIDLTAKEIKFLHDNMYNFNIGKWEIIDKTPCNIFNKGGDMDYCLSK